MDRETRSLAGHKCSTQHAIVEISVLKFMYDSRGTGPTLLNPFSQIRVISHFKLVSSGRPEKMSSNDNVAAIEEIYSNAINPEHPYHSNPQMALSLHNSVNDILQSADISKSAALKLAISYIHFESASNSSVLFPRLR
jgi:hypothetical protein